jgi:G6PDH family F420-dependent oxidoreductase
MNFVMISDHYHPWIDAQGHSPFVWSVIGGIAATTNTIRVDTGVTGPTMRTPPAIIAQAAATAASMLPGRFMLGLGSGEALNEHILGEVWPPVNVRLQMLEEAVELMQELWKGEYTTFDGSFFQTHNARIYTLPKEAIPVMIAASGPESARLAAQHDGLIATMPDPELVRVLNSEASGDNLHRFGQVTVSWAPTEEEARKTALQYWPTATVPGPLHSELTLPSHYEALVADLTEDDVAQKLPCTTTAEPIVKAIKEFVDAGYDHIYIHQVGKRQRDFLDFASREVLPALRSYGAAAG